MTPALSKASPGSQRGAALLIVLWTALLLSVVLAGALASARIEAKIAAAKKERLAADFALDAALDFASAKAASAIEFADLSLELNGYQVEVTRSIEGEKLDVNRAGESALAAFFRHAGIQDDLSDRLAAEIADWRDQDNLARPNGAEALDYAGSVGRRIGDRQFYAPSELALVRSMPLGLLECLTPAMTVFGTGDTPSARVLAAIGLQPMQDLTSEQAALITAARSPSAGVVIALEAVAETKVPQSTTKSRTRIIRITGGNPPFEQLAMFSGKEAARRSPCDAENLN